MWQSNASFAKWTAGAALVVCIAAAAAAAAAGTCPVGGYAIPACPIQSDQVIQDQVISRLSGSVSSARYPILVSVRNGVVTLRGMVETSGKRDLAGLFAWSVQGVIDVQNCLTVDPKMADDLFLVGQVRRALSKSAIDAKRIQVRASGGVVELAGTVPTDVDLWNATEVAASVPGVTAVHNNLSVYGPTGSPF